MATLTIHNIPDDLLKKLERSAKENRRAVDEEAVAWLSQVETPKDDPYRIMPSRFTSPLKPEEFVEYTDELKNKLKGKVWVTEEELNRAKREGRLGSETGESNIEPDTWLYIARQTRESTPDVFIGDEEELNRLKREGRL